MYYSIIFYRTRSVSLSEMRGTAQRCQMTYSIHDLCCSESAGAVSRRTLCRPTRQLGATVHVYAGLISYHIDVHVAESCSSQSRDAWHEPQSRRPTYLTHDLVDATFSRRISPLSAARVMQPSNGSAPPSYRRSPRQTVMMPWAIFGSAWQSRSCIPAPAVLLWSSRP